MTKFIKGHKKEIIISVGGIALAWIGGIIGYNVSQHVDVKAIKDYGLEDLIRMAMKHEYAIEDIGANCSLSDMGEYGKLLKEVFKDNNLESRQIKGVALFLD